MSWAASTRLPEVNDALRPIVADYLKVASEAFILPKFGNLQSADIGIKTGPHDLVTVADKAAESWLAPRLQDLQTGHCIGEEAVAETPELRQHAGDGYAWSIDPIDGTNNFINGVVDFCSMVALMWNGVPLQCWIWLPVKQALYYAAAGSGAFYYQDTSETVLRISQPSIDPHAMRGSGNTKGLKEPYKSAVLRRMRTIAGRHYVGSAGVLATRIAEGEEDFLMHGRATPWDHAPVDLLCREAGGHAAMVAGAKPFNAVLDGPIMAASSLVGWQELHRHVWA
jgi:fructose-1,6-bisphosphatase/inositol monophosphatase family enzyme